MYRLCGLKYTINNRQWSPHGVT